MENNIYVYRHRRLDNNQIFYIGIGTKYRPNKKTNRNKHWNNIVNKVNYQVEILYNNLSWEDAVDLEVFLIELYGRKDLNKGNLVNLTNGGEGTVGRKLSKQQCEDIKNRMKGHFVTKETRLKISISNKGKNKGKKINEETRLKMSKSQKGKIISNFSRLKMSKSKSKKIINVDTNIIYNSINEASLILKKSTSTLYRYLNNIGKKKINIKYYTYGK
jgi:hypothetical protein